jgi:hypothetical protein
MTKTPRIAATIAVDEATYGNKHVAHIAKFRMEQWAAAIIAANAARDHH